LVEWGVGQVGEAGGGEVAGGAGGEGTGGVVGAEDAAGVGGEEPAFGIVTEAAEKPADETAEGAWGEDDGGAGLRGDVPFDDVGAAGAEAAEGELVGIQGGSGGSGRSAGCQRAGEGGIEKPDEALETVHWHPFEPDSRASEGRGGCWGRHNL
jgi:hypothetical protein